MPRALLLALACLAAIPAIGQQPATYVPTADERSRLDARKRELSEALKGLPEAAAADAAVFLHVAEMADRLALYTRREQVAAVLRGLETGIERCRILREQPAAPSGQRPPLLPWQSRPGRSLRGFVSRIDGSVQPYGVVLPADFDPKAKGLWRLDVVLHGRGPTEVTFLQQNEPVPGTPAAAPPREPWIELHPFGRGNNGYRWAGETDVFEALEAVRKLYPIDPDRIVLRGFSMGGHGAWHLGVHYPHLWAAVSPGAGFADTRRYLGLTHEVPAYQEKAWTLYDAVDYALNLFNTPFIAYGGERDPQLRAALEMQQAAAREGAPLKVIVGPNTEHRYHPDSFREIMADLAEKRRNPNPERVKFVTWTLKYPRCFWVELRGLEEHYRRARVVADRVAGTVRTENVRAIAFDAEALGRSRIVLDGQPLLLPAAGWPTAERTGGRWRLRPAGAPPGRSKRPGLQGPIDDAFTSRFLVVRGTGTPWSRAVGSYADALLARFREEWRLGFRGDLPVRDDREVRPEDWRDANLVLLGDPGSNRLLARIADRLPIRWTRSGVTIAGRAFPADAVPVLIYPNPLRPERYVVINSGHTWTSREILGSNAHLTPKLPDWAVLLPGGALPEVLAAGFFDEHWRFTERRSSPAPGSAPPSPGS